MIELIFACVGGAALVAFFTLAPRYFNKKQRLMAGVFSLLVGLIFIALN